MKNKLELSEKDKAVASKAATMAQDIPNPGFWDGVQKEVSRLESKPKIKARQLRD